MAFPLSWSGDLERPLSSAAPALTPAGVLARIEAGLQRHHASVLRRGSTIRFRAGPIRAPFSWSLLNAISAGTISVEAGADRVLVRFQIRFTALFFCAVFAAAGVVLVQVFAVGGVPRGLLLVLPVVGLAALASIALAAARFIVFLSAILDRASEPERVEVE